MRGRAERHWQAVTIYLRGCDPAWSGVIEMWRTLRINPGALHTTLARMERLGVVVSRWQMSDEGGAPYPPRRRLYALASRVGSGVRANG